MTASQWIAWKTGGVLGLQMNHLRNSKHMNQNMITTSQHVDKLHSPWGSHPSETNLSKSRPENGLAIKQSVSSNKRRVGSLSSLNTILQLEPAHWSVSNIAGWMMAEELPLR
jgi:hypothetical protein